MRRVALLILGLCATAASALAGADEVRLLGGESVVGPDAGGGHLPRAARGQFLGLACTNIEKVPGDDISVVLYPDNAEDPTGIGGVLATDQSVSPGLVHVRVPDFPELSDHTLRVKVYFHDTAGNHVCDGGNVKIS
jgi:hypothetical protein